MKTLLAVLTAAVLLFSSAATAEAPGYDKLPQPTPVAELFEKAVKHGGFEAACLKRGGCPMPVVALAAIEDDNVAGLFDFHNPVFVKISTGNRIPGTLAFNATVVHEFVHYLQWLTGQLGPQTPCEARVAIEGPAYRAAAAYYAEFGIVFDYSPQMASMAFLAAMCNMGYERE